VTNSFLLTVGSTMGNHLWQTTVAATAIWLLNLLLFKNPARIRYFLWLAASLKFLLPFSLLITLGSLLPKSQQIATPAMYSAIGLAGEPFSDIVSAPAASMPRSPTPRERIASDLGVGLEGIWLTGFAAVMLIWYVRWHKLSGVLRKSKQAFVGREINLLRRVEQATGGLGQFQRDYRATCLSLASSAFSGQSCSGRKGSPRTWTMSIWRQSSLMS
jgi:bla regulator protein BlaR1